MDRQKILSYFEHETGLRCLPNFIKDAYRPFISHLTEEELANYWSNRLHIVVEVIEPLAQTPGHPFAELCDQVRKIPDLKMLAVMFKMELCVRSGLMRLLLAGVQLLGWRRLHFLLIFYYFATFSQWASRRELNPVLCLFCKTQCWSLPWPLTNCPLVISAVSLTLTAKSMANLGERQSAVWLLETFLHLSIEDYSNSQSLAAVLADSPLTELEPNARANLLRVLADAIRLVEGRGSRQSALLLEVFLGVSAEDYADPQSLAAALADSPLQELESDTRAKLLRVLAQALAFVEGRRRRHSVLLLEGFLGISAEDYADPQFLSAALADSPLRKLEFNICANLLTVLAELIGTANGRGYRHSVLLLESFLQLSPTDYADSHALTSALANFPLHELEFVNRALLACVLAMALRMVEGRGHHQSLLLLTSLLQLSSEDHADPQFLAAALTDSPFKEMEANNRAYFLSVLSRALMGTEGHGSHQIVLLMESFLKLTSADYADPQSLATALADSPLNKVESNIRAILITVLTEALWFAGVRENRHSVLLLEGFLQLCAADYAGPQILITALTKSPLNELEYSIRVSLVTRLAMALGREEGRGSLHSVLLLEGFLQLSPMHYADMQSMVIALADSPLWELEPNIRATILFHLANGLRLREQSSKAIILLNTLAGGSLLTLFSDHSHKGIHIYNVLLITAVWLDLLNPENDETLLICQHTIGLIRKTRDKQLHTYQHVVDFLSYARKLWNDIRQVLRVRIASSLQNRDFDAAEADELRLLAWGEQFENRLLFERLLTTAPIGHDGAELLPGWSPDSPGLGFPWNLDRMSQRLTVKISDAVAQALLPHEFVSSSLLSGCLHQEGMFTGSGADEMSTESHSASTLSRKTRQQLLDQREHQLHELIPSETVWLRGMFDKEGRLHWWACRSEEENVQIIARGTSKPGAERRLNLANLEFDLGVETTWAQVKQSSLSAATLSSLAQLINSADKPEILNHRPKEFFEELAKAGYSQLAALGNYLRESVQNLPHENENLDLLQIWKRGACQLVASLTVRWEEWLHYKQAMHSPPKTSNPGEINKATIQLEQRRKRELDTLSRAHLAALAAELDLSPLWAETGNSFPWSETDVLFTMPGPLLAMPLAWLDLGGKELFQQVASTSSVCSLTLRQWSADKRQEAGGVPRHMLSAFWEERERRHRFPGLALLQEQLRGHEELQEHWKVWSLGDDPQATRDNFIAALNHPEQKFGTVVVGAHGNAGRAGVQLASAHWCGEMADLTSVDLLVLVSCAVGRLNQQGDRDVEGLYAQLVGQGAATVVAARWLISDLEAAEFTVELLREYTKVLKKHPIPPPFSRARAFNRARITAQENGVTFHQVAAFDLYGLG